MGADLKPGIFLVKSTTNSEFECEIIAKLESGVDGVIISVINLDLHSISTH